MAVRKVTSRYDLQQKLPVQSPLRPEAVSDIGCLINMSDFEIKSIKGIDNTSDPTTLQLDRYGGLYAREIINTDIDDDGKPHRRGGTSSVFGSAAHSLWSNGKICLFVTGTTLKKLNSDYTSTTLISDIDTNDRMCYVSYADIKIFFSNMSIVGYVDTTDELPYTFPDPGQEFKIRMVGGQVLEIYNNRLYAANDRNLFFSDPAAMMQMDGRRNAIALPEIITMVKAVSDGIYVSTNKFVYFYGGDSPWAMKEIRVSDSPAILGMSVSVDGDNIGRGVLGKTAYWMTEDGPFKGYPGGNVIQLQDGRFGVENIEVGTAISSYLNGYWQFLSVGQFKAGFGGGSGEFTIPILETD